MTQRKIPEKYFVIDFENTGGSLWFGHKITAYGICIVEKTNDSYRITDTYTNFINPARRIPKFIENLIGIKTEDVNRPQYPTIETEFEKLEKLFSSDMIFTGHCVGVDYGMFNYLYYTKYNRHLETFTLDTCMLAKKIIGFQKGGIGEIAKELNITTGRHHQPDFDAFVAAQILIKSLELIAENPEKEDVFFSHLRKYPRPKLVKFAKKIMAEKFITENQNPLFAENNFSR